MLAVSSLAKSTDVIGNTRSRLLIVPRPSASFGPWRTEVSLRVFPGGAALGPSLGKMIWQHKLEQQEFICQVIAMEARGGLLSGEPQKRNGPRVKNRKRGEE